MNNTDKTQIISSIVEQMRVHDISLSELAEVLKMSKAVPKRDLAARLFAIFGGIFLFAGIGTYIAMFWNEMNAFAHIAVTLGTGLVAQVLAIVMENNKDCSRAVKPLQLMAIALQPTGWFVAIHELFPHGNDARSAVLFVMTLMALQQGAIFYKNRSTLILFATLLFAYIAGFALFDFSIFSLFFGSHLYENTILACMGASMIALSYGLRATPHFSLSRVGYCIGSVFLYCGTFELLHNTSLELVYLILICGLIYLSTVVRSGALLTTSTFAMLSYIGYFTNKYFVDSIGWPLSLITMGIAFFAIGGIAFKIKRRYI